LAFFAVAASAAVRQASADTPDISFRPVLYKAELDGKRYDVFTLAGSTGYVWKMRYLCERDIAKAEAFRSAGSGALLAAFTLNADGAKRLRHFTRKFGSRHLAVFVGKRLMGSIPAMPPSFIGDRIVIKWPGTEKGLRELVVGINRKPPGVIALYIEEQGRYNDTAADAWAELYLEVNRRIDSDRLRGAEARRVASESLE
jgi:hypothetical protein